jgi:RNA polymerase sigma-70 factor (ECF subfamily)
MYASTKQSPTLSELSDKDLLFGIVRDDELFRELVSRYQNRLLNFVYRFVHDYDMAEDIVQETFLRVYRKRHEYKAIAHFSTWIFTIAGNLAKSEIRRRKRWKFQSIDAVPESDHKLELLDTGMKPDHVTAVNMLDRSIQDALISLQKKYREAVFLRDIEGMSYKHITEITKVPVGTVKSRVNRARTKLQELLRDHSPGDEIINR